MLEIFAKKLAVDLFKGYVARAAKGKLDDNLLPDSVEDLQKVLGSLIPGTLDLGKISDDTQITSTILKKAEEQIKRIQGFAPAGHLATDGVIGKRMIKWLGEMKRCKGDLAHTPSTEVFNDPEPNSGDKRKVRFWYSPSGGLPTIADDDREQAAELIFAQAWLEWAKVIKIDLQRAKTKGGANVIATTVVIDSQGGVLADAHVGPPGGMVQTIRFDLSETWTAKKFKNTACHEIGHVLGLGHATGAGRLMSTFADVNIQRPTDDDVAAILDSSLGWKKRNKKPGQREVPPKPGKPIVPPFV